MSHEERWHYGPKLYLVYSIIVVAVWGVIVLGGCWIVRQLP
jgi:hypothetical protein